MPMQSSYMFHLAMHLLAQYFYLGYLWRVDLMTRHQAQLHINHVGNVTMAAIILEDREEL